MITLATQDEVSALWRKIEGLEKYLDVHCVSTVTTDGFIDMYYKNQPIIPRQVNLTKVEGTTIYD